MSEESVIRDLTPPDVEAVVEIALAARTPIYALRRQTMGEELFAAVHPDWRAQKPGQVRGACDDSSGTHVCVAERAGRVVGFVTFYADESTRTGEISNNAVHPDFQRRGIGGAMYEHVFGRLRGLGMRFARVSTGVDPAHAPARRAYEKAGFSSQLRGITYYRKL